MTERTINIDGIQYYTLQEKPPGSQHHTDPPVLLCHALMSNLHMWDSTVKALNRAGYTTIRFDHLGHNKTPPPEDKNASFHMDDIARHMHELVASVTGQPKVKAVIGCSIGGVLALRYAMLYPKDVEDIISIAAPGISAPEKAHNLWSERIVQFEKDVKDGSNVLCRQTVERWFPGSRPRDVDVRERALPLVKTCSLRGYKTLADTIRDYDYGGDLGKVEARTLIVAGSEDGAASPEGLKELSGTIAGAEYVCMDGAGHLPPMHMPEEFEELMLRFLG
ncbi:hypothetical protein CB0940_11725 [Cercospora beticola]|uniref:AB hydrolase-1 domain-containing protein n=1 Tax=Cercospora beticola TaxID=122368 RepID=A0A2G5IEA5_CERBT|nr:hypothetical protein CB0940_11725 [Cercospora beticola]PIB03109.1 hypothetical protein CB0940_11725 [Cercospora beticola]WPB04080.1 hypothetical protein RHO25_008724 [Cercospora beticola]CAK1357127.1 unnamed protein product [Cercospora beticola]